MKYFFIITVAFLSMSCFVDNGPHEANIKMPPMETFDNARLWISLNIMFSSNPSYWQTPGETIERGSGDSQDFAMLLSYYANRFGLKPTIVFSESTVGCIIGDKVYFPQYYHAWEIDQYTYTSKESYQEALYRCPGYL